MSIILLWPLVSNPWPKTNLELMTEKERWHRSTCCWKSTWQEIPEWEGFWGLTSWNRSFSLMWSYHGSKLWDAWLRKAVETLLHPIMQRCSSQMPSPWQSTSKGRNIYHHCHLQRFKTMILWQQGRSKWQQVAEKVIWLVLVKKPKREGDQSPDTSFKGLFWVT